MLEISFFTEMKKDFLRYLIKDTLNFSRLFSFQRPLNLLILGQKSLIANTKNGPSLWERLIIAYEPYCQGKKIQKNSYQFQLLVRSLGPEFPTSTKGGISWQSTILFVA